MREAYEANKAWWDEVTGPHLRSSFYDVEGFKGGRSTLPQYVIDHVGEARGTRLLHLQCHFGMDTLSWARMGAEATGVDFSPRAVEAARRLASELSIPATFECINVYDIGPAFQDSFDIVFTSEGVLGWLHDLESWASIAASCLKSGGLFYISDFHPLLDTLQDRQPIRSNADLFPANPYFNPGRPVVLSAEEGADYADSQVNIERETYEWFHSLDETIGAILRAGLQIELFEEHPFCAYRARPGMVRSDDGYWRLPENVISLPLMFSLRARKPWARRHPP